MKSRQIISVLIATAFVAVFSVSCRREGVPADSIGEEGVVDVNFVPCADATRAGGESALTDDLVNRLTVVLFKDGVVYGYKTAMSGSVSMTVNQGTYDICMVANDASFSGAMKTQATMSSSTSSFWSEAKNAMHMSGVRLSQAIAGGSSTVTVPITRAMSRVVLGSITYDVTGSNLSTTVPLQVSKVYLTNVWTTCGYGDRSGSIAGFSPTPVTIPASTAVAVDATYGSCWVNRHGLETFTESTGSGTSISGGSGEVGPVIDDGGTVGPVIGDGEISVDEPVTSADSGPRGTKAGEFFIKDYGTSPLSVSNGTTASPGLYFYCYPNSSTTTDSYADIPCTRLVIEGTIGNETMYYHVDLPGMLPNTSYNVDVTINNYGGLDAETNYSKPSISFTCSVNGWEYGNEWTQTFE